jgi:hypothetical protein
MHSARAISLMRASAKGSAMPARVTFGLILFGFVLAFTQPSVAGEGAKICKWFTRAEIRQYLGAEVKAGRVGGPLDSLCQWDGRGDAQAFIHIQIASPRSWSMPDLADGFKRVRGIGDVAYIVPEFRGWTAAAKTVTRVVLVSGSGGTLTAEKILDLLRSAAAHQ